MAGHAWFASTQGGEEETGGGTTSETTANENAWEDQHAQRRRRRRVIPIEYEEDGGHTREQDVVVLGTPPHERRAEDITSPPVPPHSLREEIADVVLSLRHTRSTPTTSLGGGESVLKEWFRTTSSVPPSRRRRDSTGDVPSGIAHQTKSKRQRMLIDLMEKLQREMKGTEEEPVLEAVKEEDPPDRPPPRRTASAPPSSTPHPPSPSPPLQANSTPSTFIDGRFLVLEASRCTYERIEPTGRLVPEKILRLFDDRQGVEKVVHLREDWEELEVQPGDIVNVLGEFDHSNRCVLDNSNSHLLILSPDTLVSGTTVGDAFKCMRRAVLSQKIRNADVSVEGVRGTMAHELFESALAAHNFATEFLETQIFRIVASKLEDLFGVEETETTAVQWFQCVSGVARSESDTPDRLRELVPRLQQWANCFFEGTPRWNARVQFDRSQEGAPLAISEVLDIEESIWSPKYGLKGKLDASVRITTTGAEGPLTALVPLELKTGRRSGGEDISHRAQVILYILLMGDRYDVEIQHGLLLYLMRDTMLGVSALRDEIRGILIARSKLACFLSGRGRLPPMKRSLSWCKSCFLLDQCMVYHKCTENGTSESAGVGRLYEEKTMHLTPAHTAYFAVWNRVIELEAADIDHNREEVWLMSSAARQKLGRCFSHMVLDDIDGATCRFRRANGDDMALARPDGSVVDVPLSPGDFVVLSTEDGKFAVAQGFLTEIAVKTVSVQIMRETLPTLFHGGAEMESLGSQLRSRPNVSKHPQTRMWRIDKDELTTLYAQVRNNLFVLFAPSPMGDEKRRRLIVDLEPPRFEAGRDMKELPAELAQEYQTLNMDQKRAVQKVFSARDYGLVLGMPGTGKTTTIIFLVKALVAMGKTILLAAYTNTAVDNMLFKLEKEGVGFLRVGRRDKVHPSLAAYVASDDPGIQTVAQLQERLNSQSVVATTCLGVNHVLFSKRTFDYCIVDEASQITQPVCLGPLRFADTFVLVGDHYQLPPIIRNEMARTEGTVSLFKRLSEKHPSAVVNLECQYRMNYEIMLVANTLVYRHRLRCGYPGVADSSLQLPAYEALLSSPSSSDPSLAWAYEALDPGRKVVFLNTDLYGAHEIRVGDQLRNDREAALVTHLARLLIQCGLQPTQLGIIAPYRSQIKAISTALGSLAEDIEVYTVDRFQGRDKECILFSLVRSNADRMVGTLLRDWRRVNVAFTRAMRKLLVIGSKGTLQGEPTLEIFLELCTSRGWIMDIPVTARVMDASAR